MKDILQQINMDDILRMAREAGEAVMEIYAQDFEVIQKEDQSPLTVADKKSNEIILDGLKKLSVLLPVISEETKLTPYEERKAWDWFWLVDPLDGTKEFIKKNGEFTINIALIHDGEPVLGVVYVPAQNVMYYGSQDKGSFKTDANGNTVSIKNDQHYSAKQNVKVVASRSHLTDETLQFVEDLKQQGKQVDFVSSGSSLKFCLVAEGAADVYPRFGPTMEWDTAAAHAVVKYAGKEVFVAQTKTPLTYNKENLLNPRFVVE